MEVYYSNEVALSEEAIRLLDFDMDSIRQVIAAERGPEPDLWVAAPESYQSDGHPLRDSESIRLIAYSKTARVVYATDGCNACRHSLQMPLDSTDSGGLSALSQDTQLPEPLLRRLAELVNL